MKLIANNYKPNEVFKIIREWTGLSQEEIGHLVGKKNRSWAKSIENGHSRFIYHDLFDICKKNGIKIIFEKD